MANPQSSYSHPNPGPSTYYPQQHAPPHYAYGTHSPGPNTGPYFYPYEPQMNDRHPHLQPTSPTGADGRGNGLYGPPSAGHSYQNFRQPQNFVVLSPHQYPHPHHPKYPQAYSPPYANPPTASYSHSWSNQEPLSPLPKQLSMPPPQDALTPSPSSHEPPPQISGPQEPVNSPTDGTPSSPPSYTHTGTISTPSSLPSSPRPTIRPPSPRPRTNAKGSWAIWSRRPHDPSQAPGIIFSPRARPPPDIVQQAISLSTPPASPEPLSPLAITTLPELEESLPHSEATTSTVPSSSATETTPTTTRHGSPVSTNTSLSAAGTPPKAHIPVEDAIPDVPLQSSPEPPTAAPLPAAPAPPKPSWASLLKTPTSNTSSTQKPFGTLPTSSVVGFSIPASPTPAPISPSKKSGLLALLTSTAPAATAGDKIRPRGLVNTGNMCFANSVLQVLVYCPPFHGLFSELGKVLLGPVVGGQKDGSVPLLEATVDFLNKFIGDEGEDAKSKAGDKGDESKSEKEKDDDWDGESFIPTNVYDAMKEKKRFDSMRGGHQEDAEEFFGFYLDTLEEEMLSIVNSISPSRANKVVAPVEEKEEDSHSQHEDGWLEVGKKNRTVVTRTIKTADSPITRIFGGKFRSTLKAPHQKDSVIIEDWRSLRLDIQREQIHTVQDALSFMSHPQSVQVTNPSRPGVTIEASQQVLIEALPPILVLHMKRFCYDTAVGGVVKIGKQVRFGPELVIGPDVMAPTARKSLPARYKLFGVLYHHGLSAGGGHYTLDVLHQNRYPNVGAHSAAATPREGWVRIDDELVSDVRSEDVFGASEKDDSRCAYLLFYKRVGGKL